MSLLCAMFGHKSHENDYSGGEYMKTITGSTDGIGRIHATLYAECPRCGATYRAGQIHLPIKSAPTVADPGPRCMGMDCFCNGDCPDMRTKAKG